MFPENVKFQNIITSLFLIRFSSFLHCSVGNIFLFLLNFQNSGVDFFFNNVSSSKNLSYMALHVLAISVCD